MNLTEQQKLWGAALLDSVERKLPMLSYQAALLVVAHAAHESGFGRCNAWKRGFNAWNLTAGPAWTGAKWTEVNGDTDGKGNPITQTWRAYGSMDDAVADYWLFLGPTANRGRYVRARDALSHVDVNAFVRELHNAGFFTANPVGYLAAVQTIFKGLGGVTEDITEGEIK